MTVKLVRMTACARAGFEMCVCTNATRPGICLLALSLAANREFPSLSLPTQGPHSQQHCQSERFSGRGCGVFFFGSALGV